MKSIRYNTRMIFKKNTNVNMHNVNKNVYKGKKQFIHKTDKII